MSRKLELAGQRFGTLTVIKQVPRNTSIKKRYTYWLCQCDCGKMHTVAGYRLTTGHTTSCGCLKIQRIIEVGHKNATHGGWGSRLYRAWRSMKVRCYDSNCKEYKYYGARGITVCEEWRRSFEPFRDWALKNGYDDNLSIDRIDVNGNYEPSNCRWATCKEQLRNTTRTHLFNGKTLAEWAEIKGINKSTLATRIYARHWDIDRAINTQVKHRKLP